MDAPVSTYWRYADVKDSQFRNVSTVARQMIDEIEPVRQDDLEETKRVRQAIESAAPKHLDLLRELQRTQHAVRIVQENEYKMDHLLEEMRMQSKVVEEAASATDCQLAKYRKAQSGRGSRKRGFNATTLEGSLPQSEETAQAYYNTLVLLSRAEHRMKELKQDVTAIEHETESVSDDAKRHKLARKQIDQLYSDIFDGETPGFPAEDRCEEGFKRKQCEHSATIATLKATERALKSLTTFKSTFTRVQDNCDRAKSELEKTHIFSGLSYIAVLLERIADLVEAIHARAVDMVSELPKPLALDFAEEHGKLVKHLTAVRAAATSVISVPYVLASKSAGHEAVQVIEDETCLASEAYTRLVCMLKSDESTAKAAIKVASRSLEDSKQALREIRENAFEELIGHGISPPPYHKHCDTLQRMERDADDQCIWCQNLVFDNHALAPPPDYTTVSR